MKIRIRGNSVRFRLTKDEVEKLCTVGSIKEETHFSTSVFSYAVNVSETENLSIDFKENKIELKISEALLGDWNLNNKIGFSHTVKAQNAEFIDLLLEKDFTCLDDRGEDESNNYPNPKATIHHG